MKRYLILILISTAFIAHAQSTKPLNLKGAYAYDDAIWNCDDQAGDSYQTEIGTDIFGNQIKTFKDANGRILRSVQRSKDIFGKLTTTVSDGYGHTILAIDCATDIMGKETVRIIGEHDKQLGYMSRHTDIMGAKITTIRDDVHNTTTIITRSTDIFGNKQVKTDGPRNNFDDMLACFIKERLN